MFTNTVWVILFHLDSDSVMILSVPAGQEFYPFDK